MILMCPHCGRELQQPLKNGLSACLNCRRTFDSTHRNKMLSDAWFVRRYHVGDIACLMDQCQTPADDANFVVDHVFYKCYSHEDFVEVVDSLMLT